MEKFHILYKKESTDFTTSGVTIDAYDIQQAIQVFKRGYSGKIFVVAYSIQETSNLLLHQMEFAAKFANPLHLHEES